MLYLYICSSSASFLLCDPHFPFFAGMKTEGYTYKGDQFREEYPKPIMDLISLYQAFVSLMIRSIKLLHIQECLKFLMYANLPGSFFSYRPSCCLVLCPFMLVSRNIVMIFYSIIEGWRYKRTH